VACLPQGLKLGEQLNKGVIAEIRVDKKSGYGEADSGDI